LYSSRNWDGSTKPRLEFQGSYQKQLEQQQHFTVGGDANLLFSYSTMSSPPFGAAPGEFKRKRDLDESLRRGSTKKWKLRDFVIEMVSRLLFIPNQKKNLIDKFKLTGGHGTSSDKCTSRYSCLYIVCTVLPEKSDLEETRRVDFLDGAAAAAHATSIDECVSRYVRYKYPFSKDFLAEEKFDIELEKSQESRRDFPHGHSQILLSQCSTLSNMNREDRVKDIGLNVIGDIPEHIDESCGNLKVRMVPSNCEYSGDADCENVHPGVINPSVSMQMDWHVAPDVETTTNVVVDSHELQAPMQCVVEVPPILGTTQQGSYATDNSDCDDSADAAGIMGGGGGGHAQNLRRTCRLVETVAASSFPAGPPSFKSARKRHRTMCGSSESIDGEEFKVTDSPDSAAEEEEIASSLLESFSVNVSVNFSADHGVESSSNVLLEGPTCCKQPMILSTSSQLLMLTEDLQNKVFAKLPTRDVFRLRTCCPAFRDLPNRDSFKQARSIESRDDLDSMYSPMFFSVHNGVLEWAGYDLALQEWRTLPSLNCLPSPDPGLLKEFLIAGGDGLLCFTVGKSFEDPKLVVCNPLTQETRVLPQMNFPRHPVLMHLLVDRCKNSYKVIVAGSSTTGTEQICRKTEVYCSKTGSWVVTGELPGPDFGLNEYQNGAFCDGVLYCVAIADNAAGNKVVLAYHMEKGIWLTNWYCPIPSFRCQVYFATTQIVGFGGSIFVFSEQEYLKDVKFCIARLDCIEMGPTKQKYYMEQPNWSSASNLSEQPGLVRPYCEAPEAYKQENMWSSLINKHMDSELWERILKEPKEGKWTKLLQEPRQGSRGLLVYPENTCVAQESENKLCIFNTVEHTMVIHDFENNSCNNNQTRTELRRNKKKFHSLNPLGFTFKPNFNASV
jgi:F-box interacting protein